MRSTFFAKLFLADGDPRLRDYPAAVFFFVIFGTKFRDKGRASPEWKKVCRRRNENEYKMKRKTLAKTSGRG